MGVYFHTPPPPPKKKKKHKKKNFKKNSSRGERLQFILPESWTIQISNWNQVEQKTFAGPSVCVRHRRLSDTMVPL
jgi:hypothetical protein